MTSTTGEAVVVVSRRIEAPAEEIFRILADPGQHSDLDGSGMLRGGVSGAVVSGTRTHPRAPGPRGGHRWIFDLLPDSAGATVVIETFDGSRMPEDKRAEVDSGRAWWQTQMASTLERLAELCAAR